MSTPIQSALGTLRPALRPHCRRCTVTSNQQISSLRRFSTPFHILKHAVREFERHPASGSVLTTYDGLTRPQRESARTARLELTPHTHHRPALTRYALSAHLPHEYELANTIEVTVGCMSTPIQSALGTLRPALRPHCRRCTVTSNRQISSLRRFSTPFHILKHAVREFERHPASAQHALS
jgi:hypothetical protein